MTRRLWSTVPLAAGLLVAAWRSALAILMFATSFMLLSGVQIMLGSGMDARKTFAVGIALTFGLGLAPAAAD